MKINTPSPAREHAPIEHGVSNRAFLLALGKALLALAASAAILMAAFVTLYPHAPSATAQNRVISGNEFSVVFGGAGKSSQALQLGELSENGRAILARSIRFQAKDYPFIEFNILDRSPGQNIYLLWRTKENPKKTVNARLYWNGNEPVTIDMRKNIAWKGEITELAFDIYGDLRGQPIEFQQLTLKPYARSTLLSAIWSEWKTYRGWSQKSTAHLRGTQSKSAVSPTLVAASWAGLALLLLLCAGTLDRGPNKTARQLPAMAAALLIPWIALDLLWQSDLATQLDETKTLFAGKTQHEKHLADREGTLYAYAQHLKENFLPAPGKKILLLHDSDHMTYTRLKAQYYLLPHNVFNYDRLPQENAANNADYILALGDIEALVFSEETDTLNWTTENGKNESLVASLIERHPLGALYKIERQRE